MTIQHGLKTATDVCVVEISENFLPAIQIPAYCRPLAEDIGVITCYSLQFCLSAIHTLYSSNNKNSSLYREWIAKFPSQLTENDKKYEMLLIFLFFFYQFFIN